MHKWTIKQLKNKQVWTTFNAYTNTNAVDKAFQ